MSGRGAYYNEIDPWKATWLRELIKAGAIADGEVDERSVADVRPEDLRGFTQWHMFAGIGVWSYALRLAGWPDNREVFTFSCPCQPFSAAGKKKGFADRRHLWPECYRIVGERRPVVCFGEQVQTPDGLAWLDLVSADLESCAYTVGAAGLCSAGVGAPHARNRLFFVAHASGKRRQQEPGGASPDEAADGRAGRNGSEPYGGDFSSGGCAAGIMGDPDKAGLQRRSVGGNGPHKCAAGSAGMAGVMGHATVEQDRPYNGKSATGGEPSESPGGSGFSGGHFVGGYWSSARWLPCRDNTWRPAEPAPFGMADESAADLGRMRISCAGIPEGAEVFFPLIEKGNARVGRVRGYGDAIVAELAAEFIRTYMEVSAEDV